MLWHAQTPLREFRGDAHVAALTLQGLSGLEALVCHEAIGEDGCERLRALARPFSRTVSEAAFGR